jgi:uncharacterized protein (DUF305 family)
MLRSHFELIEESIVDAVVSRQSPFAASLRADEGRRVPREARANTMMKKDVLAAAIIGCLLTLEGVHVVRFWQESPMMPAVVARDPAGRELDRQFVHSLISRYKDTLQLAEKESVSGHNPELRRLAAALVEARRRDIASLEKFAPGE